MRSPVVLATGAAVALGPWPAAAAHSPVPHVIVLPDPGLPADQAAAAALAAAGTTKCSSPSSDPVQDDQPILVTLPPAPTFTVGAVNPRWWRNPPLASVTWQLGFLGLQWLGPLAQRAYDDDQTKALGVVAEQAVTFQRQNPDPGDSRYGWDEGTAMRRLQTLNCLYALTRSSRLVPAMEAAVAVQFSSRYAGPPRHSVHNHGVLANLAVLDSARLLGRTTWRDRVISRMKSEAPLAWTRVGTTWEQSTSYHKLNINLWNRAATEIAKVRPTDPAVTRIRTLTARADRVCAWMTEPDGKIVLIGDSDEAAGTTRSTWTTRVFRDDQAGLAVGRWSWTDPASTYYSLRYGPPRWAHGQQDRIGTTWTARGQRILVNPGRYSYDASGYRTYALSQASHNVATVAGALKTNVSATVAAVVTRARVHMWTLTDRLYGASHSRGVIVDVDHGRLTVTDAYAAGRSFRQKWHVAPAWTLTSKGSRRLTFASGKHRLVVTTTGVFALVQRAVNRPVVAGWYFPKEKTRVADDEITVTWGSGKVTTTFATS